MLSCKDVCHFVSESLDRKLTWRERFRVKFHLLMCAACQQMARQMELLRVAAHHCGSTNEETLHPDQGILSKEARARILARLRQTKSDSTDNE
jgi:predicted anti-sigma-YlaC factor YlaD